MSSSKAEELSLSEYYPPDYADFEEAEFDDIPPLVVPVEALLEYAPQTQYPWYSVEDGDSGIEGVPNIVEKYEEPITDQEILEALLDPDRLKEGWRPWRDNPTREFHITKIAFLSQDPTQWDALELDLYSPTGDPDDISWPILDGHHRLAAAVFLGHELIEVCVSGYVDMIPLLFPEAYIAPPHPLYSQ